MFKMQIGSIRNLIITSLHKPNVLKVAALSLSIFIIMFFVEDAFAQSQMDSDTTVVIGNQVWMTENLNTSHFKNGEQIPEAKTAKEWEKAREDGIPVWSYYDGDSDNGEAYGRLYNLEAIQDERGICPDSWLVPTDSNWKHLELHLGLDKQEVEKTGWRGDAGGKLKSGRMVPKSHPRWDLPNTDASNSSGFSALPGGYRTGNPNYAEQQENSFRFLGKEAAFWYAEGGGRALSSERADIFRGGPNLTKGFGFAVRCVKN